MKTRHLVDPEFWPALDQLKAFDDYFLENLPHLRAQMKDMCAHMAANLPVVPEEECREVMVPGPKGGA